MHRPRLLFADDEPSIRATLPEILKLHGFDVAVAGSVVEALAAIQSQSFDVLLTDLNIGEPGDGFTLVSAMRRTHPEAITIIITGYPAFETALQAIRSQVDEYMVKPTDAVYLVQRIHDRLQSRERHIPKPLKRLSYILEENAALIDKRFRMALQDSPAGEHPETVPAPPASVAQIPDMVRQLVNALRLDLEDIGRKPSASAGAAVQEPGIRLSLKEARVLRRIIYTTVQENLLSVEVSWLISDLALVNEMIDLHVQDAGENVQAA